MEKCRWSIIAAQLPGRTDNDIKNYWNTKLKKKLMALAPESQRKTLPLPSHHHPPLSSQMSFLSLCKYSSSPSSSSYPFYNSANSIKNSFTGFDPLFSTVPSNLLANLSNQTGISTNTSSSLFQTQQGFMNPDPIQFYHQPRDSSNLLVFGSTEASCSSNSDGSCSQIKQEDNIGFHQTNYNNIGGFEDNQKFMLSYGSNGENLNQWGGDKKANNGSAYLGETELDYDLEDVKQLISSSNNDNNSSSSILNLMSGKSKTQEKLMYYYYY